MRRRVNIGRQHRWIINRPGLINLKFFFFFVFFFSLSLRVCRFENRVYTGGNRIGFSSHDVTVELKLASESDSGEMCSPTRIRQNWYARSPCSLPIVFPRDETKRASFCEPSFFKLFSIRQIRKTR